MEPLDPELQSLVTAERAEVEPAAADRDRVGRALGARVGAGFGLGLSLVSAPAAGASSAVGSALLLKLGAVVVLAGAVAGVAIPRLAQSPEPAPAPPALAAPAPSAPAVAQPSVVSLPAAEPTAAEPSRGSVSAARAPSVASTNLPPLAEEARLLKQAQQALRDGNAAAALSALGEHQRRFPGGQLALERSAARVQALCGLGRKQQAEREAKAFLQQHPSSGLSAQVRASCGLAPP